MFVGRASEMRMGNRELKLSIDYAQHATGGSTMPTNPDQRDNLTLGLCEIRNDTDMMSTYDINYT